MRGLTDKAGDSTLGKEIWDEEDATGVRVLLGFKGNEGNGITASLSAQEAITSLL